MMIEIEAMPSTTRKAATARTVQAAVGRGRRLTGRCCVVVANALRARVYVVEDTSHPGAPQRLAEQADLINAERGARGPDATGIRTERNTNRQYGPVHPIGEKRAQHRAEIERRFAHDIAGHVKQLCGNWKTGVVILAANPKMLGMLRGGVRAVVPASVLLKELRRDYTALTPSALARQLRLVGR
jgi:protein required for attachment to host cells